MARLVSCGWELNSSAAGIEVSSISGGPLITSSSRSGSFSLEGNNGGGSETQVLNYAAVNTQGNHFFRVYFKIVTPSTSSNLGIISTRESGGGTKLMIRLSADNTLNLYNFEDSAQIGSASSPLTTGQWYRIEFRQDTTTLASTVVEARIDGVTFASGTISLAAAPHNFRIGQVGADATCVGHYDDAAVNDSTGSFQNSWPGEGKIIHLLPNAAGDSNQWLNTAAGAGSPNNYTLVDEVTPNDATDLVQSSTLDDIDMYNLLIQSVK